MPSRQDQEDPPDCESGRARNQVQGDRQRPDPCNHRLEPEFVSICGGTGSFEPKGGQEEMADSARAPKGQNRTSLGGIDRLVKGFTLYGSLPGYSALPGRLFEGHHIGLRRHCLPEVWRRAALCVEWDVRSSSLGAFHSPL